MSIPSPTILIVDDTPVNVELIQAVLSAEGFHTLTACDGPAARSICHTNRPDLILLDVMMPGESGFETCIQLKADPSTAAIPIIFLSALGDVDSKVIGMKVGGVDYIAKPVHRSEVLARIRVHLRIRAANDELLRGQRERLDQLRDAQQAILVRPESCPDAHFAVYYRPLEEAGGDFYDVIPIGPNCFGYFVADISGHGASAAFLTSAVKALLRQYASPEHTPEDIMTSVDLAMRQMLGEEQYLTACYAYLNRYTHRLSVVSAGHPPLILVSQSGETQVVAIDGDPLGAFGSAVLAQRDLHVSRGDRLFLYSDGLIESSPGGGRSEGIQRLVDACVRNRMTPLPEVAAKVVKELYPDFRKGEDDLLLLAVEAIV